MPVFEGRFFSIVLVGRQNPRILNHDFLIKHDVLPLDQHPFSELLALEEGKQFTEFVSVPVLATIKYGPISIVVEENRYQIIDNRLDDPASSPIIQITKNYFGKLLRYTPFQVGGVNLNGLIRFEDVEEEHKLDERLGLQRKALCDIAESADVRAGLTFSAPWHKGVIEVQLPKPKERTQPGTMNLNYEFPYEGIDSFLANLDDIGLVWAKFRSILDWVGVSS